jgi:hypothetical protein
MAKKSLIAKATRSLTKPNHPDGWKKEPQCEI